MPTRSLRKCTYPGCHTLVSAGRCTIHSSKRIERDPRIKKLYNDPRWQVLRSQQLSVHPWCIDCMKDGRHIAATEVDHIRPHGGDPQLFYDKTNLQSLCKVHHSRKTAREVWR